MDPARTKVPEPPPGRSAERDPTEARAAARAATEPGAPERPPTRRWRNYLLDGPLQLGLASHLLAVAAALSLGLGWLLWSAYRETSRVVALVDPDAAGALAAALAAEDRGRIVAVASALAAVLACLLVAAVVITHRIAGPAFVLGRICRRVGEGDLTPPRPLRSRDQLVGLASEVAAMVEALRAREARERELLARAAAALREGDPGRGARAAAELEALADEKGSRLGP